MSSKDYKISPPPKDKGEEPLFLLPSLPPSALGCYSFLHDREGLQTRPPRIEGPDCASEPRTLRSN